MSQDGAVVYVVDDDAELRQSLTWLLKSVGLEVRTFASGREFLDGYDPGRPGCVLLDLRMPQMGGLELQEHLLAREFACPIIIITGYAEVPAAVRAMKAGAVDFIEKPFSDQTLVERVQRAIERAVEAHQERQRRRSLSARLGRLTPRETQVMHYVVDGLANKQVAARLGLSERTVEIHRAQVMRKLEVESVADLVRVALQAQDSRGSASPPGAKP